MSYGYFCRITPHSEYQATYNLSIISAGLSLISNKYFVCYEIDANRPHYHFLIYTDMSSETLRARLKKMFNSQVYISGKEIEDQVKAVAYCMKDGTWTQTGMDINTILMASSTSKKKVKFDDLVDKVIKDYETSEVKDKRKLIGGIIDAHVTCNRKVYMPHIKALAILCQLKATKTKSLREYLIDKIVDEL